MKTTEAARSDVIAGRWNPFQFGSESDRLAYARSWEYFGSMRGGR